MNRTPDARTMAGMSTSDPRHVLSRAWAIRAARAAMKRAALTSARDTIGATSSPRGIARTSSPSDAEIAAASDECADAWHRSLDRVCA